MNVMDFVSTFGGGESLGLLAYIDPGTGSYVFQMLVAGLLTVVMCLRTVRDYVRAWFYRILGRRSDKPAIESSSTKPGTASQ